MSFIRHRCPLSLSVLVLGLSASTAFAQLVTIETVPVGNPANAPDPRPVWDGTSGYGQVNYGYNIGKYDVTAGQYTAFLNAVAATSDPYGLYNSNMANGYARCGISQTSTGFGGYTYATTKNANLPVNYISFWNACRFSNWLQNGQPTNVQEGVGTTETGAYDLTNPTNIASNTVIRTDGAIWVVASENECYKAAYYDPTLNSGAGGYWSYPTRSNTAPGHAFPDTGNNANCSWGGGNHMFLDYLSPVGAFTNSPSAYGTYDQGGDVWQWNDTIINDGSVLKRGQRGGSFDGDILFTKYTQRGRDTPASATNGVGFRVVQLVPEPASLGMFGLGTAGLLLRRRGASNRSRRLSSGPSEA
jgi:formylglycine-generating enzyme